ncbi:glycine-rich domain-containing protein [Streptomyces rimosus]|uniref:glycine-rich domain-containing protein n=1 Tax=Streptomyces rimosus TaxID=1927 RepID=UPI0004C581CF
MTVATERRTGRELVDADLFDSLANFVVIHDGESRERAERITDQAVAFLASVGGTDVPLVPSDDVDKGLHAFILHTREYAKFCEQNGGRFLHHTPAGPGNLTRTYAAVEASARAMKARGFLVHEDLWTVNGLSAGQCDSDDGRPYAV